MNYNIKITIFVDFVRKNTESDKFGDHCYLTGKFRRAAHKTCNINVTQKQSDFLPFVFHNFRFYD